MKRIAAFLAMIMVAIGLAFVGATVVAPSASAHGTPATGTHKVKFKCDDGLYHSTMEIQYNLTYLSTLPSGESTYTFTLMWATYTGNTPNPSRGPQVLIYSQSGTGYTDGVPNNATDGTYNSTSKYPFGPDAASKPTAPTKTNTAMTGSNGAPWSSWTLGSSPYAKPQLGRVFWFSGQHPDCGYSSYSKGGGTWDLSNPDAPLDGTVTTSNLSCVSPALPNQEVPTDVIDANYTVSHVSGDIFSFKLNNVHLDRWHPGGDIYDGFTSALNMHLEDSIGTVLDVAPTNVDHPIEMTDPVGALPNPLVIEEGQDLPGGVENYPMTYPTVQFEYQQGGTIPKLSFLIERDGVVGGQTVPDCTISWDIADAWNAAEDTYSNVDDISFYNCTGGASTGHLIITSYWTLNSNGNKVKSDHVQIQNNNTGAIKLHAGTGVQNPKYQSGVFGTTDLTYMNSSATTADRTWAAGQTKNVNISSPLIWTAIASGLESSAPSLIKIAQPPNVAALAMDWDVFDVSGNPCAPGTSDLQDTIATSDL